MNQTPKRRRGNLLLNAEARRIPILSSSVHCIVTSPPYWNLRQYAGDQAQIWGGDPDCEHEWGAERVQHKRGQVGARLTLEGGEQARVMEVNLGQYCQRCGAWFGELGLEPDPDQYVNNMREIFRELWRVLRPDGTVWLNISDSYTDGNNVPHAGVRKDRDQSAMVGLRTPTSPGLKPKDLVGIPWRLAFALQADGWYLRDAIIWAKAWMKTDQIPLFDMPVTEVLDGGVMPGSQTDRPTSAYEFIFLLSKERFYFFDQDGIRADSGAMFRNVWRINQASYAGAHFATYTSKIPEYAIRFGTSEWGVCPICGAPWEREVEKPDMAGRPVRSPAAKYESDNAYVRDKWAGTPKSSGRTYQTWRDANPDIMKDWRPTCEHAGEPVPAVVLDPFVGSGSTLIAAQALGRTGVGVDLSLPYLRDHARERLELGAWKAWTQGKDGRTNFDGLPMFSDNGGATHDS